MYIYIYKCVAFMVLWCFFNVIDVFLWFHRVVCGLVYDGFIWFIVVELRRAMWLYKFPSSLDKDSHFDGNHYPVINKANHVRKA